MDSLKGKSALITGGASGIGRAIAQHFAGEGASVVIADRDTTRGQAAAREIQQRGGSSIFFSCDVTVADDCRRAVQKTSEAFGPLNLLVNNAGIIARRSVVDLEEEEWDRVMDVNVKSVYLMSKFAIPIMRAAGGGNIINTSSGWGLAGGPNAAVYCASKGAVVLLTKAMAIDFGPDGIRVNCLCPGDTDTDMLREEARQLEQAEADVLAESARRPLGRVGTPDDIAKAALFLAADQSGYVTGTTLVVDGGGLAGG